MSATLVVGIGIVLVVWWLVSRARRFAALFGDPHLLEIGRGLARIKAAALARVMRDASDAPTAGDDPRVLSTSAGLAIVHRIISDHGGRVVVGSVPTGGARITVELPIKPGQLLLASRV